MTSKQSIRHGFKRAAETTGHARATAELDDRRIAEDTSGRYSEQSRRAAALRADILHAVHGSPAEAALLEQALAEFSDTTAERVAGEMGDDGTRWTAPDGRSLHAVARAHGAEVYRDEQGERSYRFSDGSAIATSGGAWDVVHEDCTCLWCWAGAGEPRCDEQTGSEWRCTLTDDEAEEQAAAPHRWIVTTDAVTTDIEADDEDEAARKFAASEKIDGIDSADDLRDWAEALGGWCHIVRQ